MTISEYRAAVKRCCGKEAGYKFCETFGCGNVQELLAEIDRLKDLCQYEGTCYACGGPTRYYPRCDKCAAEQPK